MVYRMLGLAGLLLAAAGLLFHAEREAQTARTAVEMCTRLLIPSLLPFFVVSTLLVRLRYADALGTLFGPLMRGLFRVNGRCSAAFLLGLAGGYPVGARTAIALYREGACSRTEAERLMAFCSNSGPAFILGVVGSGIFGSAGAGLRLYAIHILASVLVGIGFRVYRHREGPQEAPRGSVSAPPGFIGAFTESVADAGAAVLRLSAFVVLFAVLTDLFFAAGWLSALADLAGRLGADVGLTAQMAEALLRGCLEVTTGLWSLAGAQANLTANLALAACLLGWAGLCVHCQVLSFLDGSGLSARPYLTGRLLQGLLSAVLTALVLRLWPLPVQTAAVLTDRLQALAQASPLGTLLSSCAAGLTILWISILPAAVRQSATGMRRRLAAGNARPACAGAIRDSGFLNERRSGSR